MLSTFDEDTQLRLNSETPSIRRMKTVRSTNGDVLRDDDFIVFKWISEGETEETTKIGRINEMWKWTSGETMSMTAVVRLWRFTEEPFIGAVLGHAEPEPASVTPLLLPLVGYNIFRSKLVESAS